MHNLMQARVPKTIWKLSIQIKIEVDDYIIRGISNCSENEIGIGLKDEIQGAQKTGLYLRVDNFATVSGRKACDMSEVYKFYLEKKYNTCMPVRLNILC